MKRIFKFLFIILLITACTLLYVGLQIELYRVSYSIHKNKQILIQTQDDYERIRIRLFKAKALDILENKIEAAKMPLTLPVEIKTIHIEIPENKINPVSIESGKPTFSLLQFVREAHAKMISSDKE